MLFEIITMTIVGTLFCVLGLKIWRKEQITLIHDYHYKKVKECDKKAYTGLMGKAIVLMGLGMYLTGIINFITSAEYGWIAFVVCFLGGLIIMFKAQMKYNKGIF